MSEIVTRHDVTFLKTGKVKLLDGEGNPIESTGGALHVTGGGGGSGVDPVGLKNVAEDTINPATEDTLALIKAKTDNLDLALTALRDALRVLSSKTLTDLDTRLGDIDSGKLEETTFTGRVGEVQASPTANTLLARLKDLLTGIVLAAGSNAIGKLAANSGVDIGDVDVLTMPAITHGKTLKYVSGTCASSGNNTILSAVPGKKITVYAFSAMAISTSVLSVLVLDGSGGSQMWGVRIQTPTDVASGANLAVTPPGYLFQGTTNTALIINLNAATTVQYSFAYWEE